MRCSNRLTVMNQALTPEQQKILNENPYENIDTTGFPSYPPPTAPYIPPQPVTTPPANPVQAPITIQPFMVLGNVPENLLVYDINRALIPPVMNQLYPPVGQTVYSNFGQPMFVANPDQKPKTVKEQLSQVSQTVETTLKPISRDINKASEQITHEINSFFKKLF